MRDYLVFPNFVANACCNPCCDGSVSAQRVESVTNDACRQNCCFCIPLCPCCGCGGWGNVGGTSDNGCHHHCGNVGGTTDNDCNCGCGSVGGSWGDNCSDPCGSVGGASGGCGCHRRRRR